MLMPVMAAQAQISGSQSVTINSTVGTLISTGTGGWMTGIDHPSIASWNISAPNLPSGLQLLPNGAFAGNTWGLYLFGTPTAAFTGQVVVTVTQPGKTGSGTLTIDFTIVGPPSLSGQSFSQATVGRPFSGTITASGGTGAISYSVTGGALPSGISLSSGGALSGSPTQSGTFNFTVTATDGNALTASQSYSITVNPAVSIAPISTVYGTVGQVVTVTPSVSGGTSPITWSMSPSISGFSNSTGVFSATPVSSGTVSVTLTATDANGSSASQSYSIVIANPVTISTNNPPSGVVGSAYSHSITASGGATPYTFTNTTALPAGLSLGSNGTISGTPTTAGNTSFSVTATDTNGRTASMSVSITILAGITLSSSGLTPITVGGPQTGSLQASGGSGGPYTFALTGGSLPAGLSLANSGSITGTATAAGTASFTVTATGAGSISGSQSFSWTVNPAISMTTSSLTASTVGIALNRSITSTGGTGSITYSLQSGSLPPGISLSGASLAGTFSTAGSYSFTILATDSTGATAQQSFSQLVNPSASIQGESLPSGWVGRSVTSSLSVSGGTAPFSFQVSSGSLPPGISLSGSGTLSGAYSAPGSFSFTVQITDSAGAVSTRSFSVSVRAAMTIGPSGALPPATVGAPFEIVLRSSSQAGGVTFSLGAAVPPPGLTFSGNSISGIPTAAGSYSLGVQAVTSDGETASAEFTLVINPALQFNVPSPQTLYVGKPMTWTPILAGGTPPLLVKLLGSSLPNGYTLNSATGQISGTPTAPGTLEFTLEATDANAARVQRFVTMPILVPVQLTTSIEAVYPLNQPVSIPLSASSGTAPYSFSLASGSLPEGIQLEGARLTGTPVKAGAYTFTLRASDSLGASADRTYKTLVASGFMLSSSKLQFLVQPGQTSPVQTLKLDANPAGVPVTLSANVPWLKSSHSASSTPGAVDFWVELPPDAETGEFSTDVLFQSQGLPAQTLTVSLRSFKAADAAITADFISSGTGQHTVSLRAQLPEVPFEAALEGPGAISYQLSARSGVASSTGAFGLLISPSANPSALSLDTKLVLRNGLTGEVLSFTVPTGGLSPILLSSHDLSMVAAPDAIDTMEAEVFVRTQSGSRRFASTVDSPWLSMTPSLGVIDPTTRLTLRINPAQLAAGDNLGLITIYLEDGRPAATIRVLVAVTAVELSPTVDQSALVFTPGRSSASLQLRNPGSRTVPFALVASDPALQVNLESGQLAPGESRTVQVSARPFTLGQSLFVSFGDGTPAVIDAFWLAPQANCEVNPTISWLAPARGASLKAGVSTKVQALLTNGCGTPLTQGSLSLLPKGGAALSLLHSGDGLWTTLWSAVPGDTIELLYLSPDGLRQSRKTLSVDVK